MTDTSGPTRSAPEPERAAASERIYRAGVSLFGALGYHGTSVRALADAVELEPASLYHHFPSKQDILLAIFRRTMDDLLAGLDEALGGDEPHEARLRRFVRHHVLFHVERQDAAFISHSELRSLTGPNRRAVSALRDRYESRFRAFLDDGVAAGVFDVDDVPLTTIAVLTLCSGVADWFRSGDRLSAEAVADLYAEMILRMVGARRLRSTPPGGAAPPAEENESWHHE